MIIPLVNLSCCVPGLQRVGPPSTEFDRLLSRDRTHSASPIAAEDPPPRRRGFHQAAQLGFRLLHFALHFPRDFAVAEVALHAAAQRAMYSASAKSILNRKRERAPERQQVVRRGRGEAVHGVERAAHGGIVELPRPTLRHQLGSVETQVPGVRLTKLLAAPVPVQIAIRADIDDEIVGVEAAAETGQDSSRAVREPSATSITSGAHGGAPSASDLRTTRGRAVRHRVEQSGGECPPACRWGAPGPRVRAPARGAPRPAGSVPPSASGLPATARPCRSGSA